MNIDFLDGRQRKVLEWIQPLFKDKVRRGTGEPYINHCIRVAKTLYRWSKRDNERKILVTAGLLHDTIEDVPSIKIQDIIDILTKIGYYATEIARIVEILLVVTKLFTKSTYPNVTKQELHKMEMDRLKKSMGLCKIVKMADVYDNLFGLELTGDFAKKYIFEQYDKIISCSGIDEEIDSEVEEQYKKTYKAIFNELS